MKLIGERALPLVFLACRCFGLARSSVVNIQSVGDGAITFKLDGLSQKYYVPSTESAAPAVQSPDVTWIKGHGPEEETFVAFTSFHVNDTTITGQSLEILLATYLEDDVYDEDFLEGVYLSGPQGTTIDKSAVDFLTSRSTSYLILNPHLSVSNLACNSSMKLAVASSTNEVLPGPFLASIGASTSGRFTLRKVFALVPDLQQAFMSGFTQSDDGSFAYAHVWDSAQYGLMIPVPSRLYSSTLDEAKYPLAGLRFATKDLMPVSGVLTSGGSREMLRLYDIPDSATTPAIQHLIDLGAVLVGKTKLTVFAFGAWPYQTDDFAYSWNARADGYLGLSASSYGSAAAIAAYDYLDFTIGTDTLGSVRNPADRVGVYGIRPTWSVINTSMVIPSAVELDTIGFFAKTPSLMQLIGKAWDTNTNAALQQGTFTLPKKIIYPSEFFPVNNSIAQTLIDSWLANLTSALNMTVEQQNLTALFQAHVDPDTTPAAYTANISSLTSYDNYNLFGKRFLSDYDAKFGRYPELDIAASSTWEASPDYTTEERDKNEKQRQGFEEFINTHAIPASNETCTEGFWVYHISDKGGGVPEYRDVLTYDDFPPFKPMRAANIAPFAKLVDITVPIGAITYNSVISKREEPLVITLNFVAHKGCDLVLLEFLVACAEAGLCQDVKTGRFAF